VRMSIIFEGLWTISVDEFREVARWLGGACNF
jgi:hypothetical protein